MPTPITPTGLVTYIGNKVSNAYSYCTSARSSYLNNIQLPPNTHEKYRQRIIISSDTDYRAVRSAAECKAIHRSVPQNNKFSLKQDKPKFGPYLLSSVEPLPLSSLTLEDRVDIHGHGDSHYFEGYTPKLLANLLKDAGLQEIGVLKISSCNIGKRNFLNHLKEELDDRNIKVGYLSAPKGFSADFRMPVKIGKIQFTTINPLFISNPIILFDKVSNLLPEKFNLKVVQGNTRVDFTKTRYQFSKFNSIPSFQEKSKIFNAEETANTKTSYVIETIKNLDLSNDERRAFNNLDQELLQKRLKEHFESNPVISIGTIKFEFTKHLGYSHTLIRFENFEHIKIFDEEGEFQNIPALSDIYLVNGKKNNLGRYISKGTYEYSSDFKKMIFTNGTKIFKDGSTQSGDFTYVKKLRDTILREGEIIFSNGNTQKGIFEYLPNLKSAALSEGSMTFTSGLIETGKFSYIKDLKYVALIQGTKIFSDQITQKGNFTYDENSKSMVLVPGSINTQVEN